MSLWRKTLLVCLAMVCATAGTVAADIRHPAPAHAVSCCSQLTYATGISLHENVDPLAVIHWGFTFQPMLTTFIAAAINQYPSYETAAQNLTVSLACVHAGALFGPVMVLWVALCSATVAYYGTALVNAFKAAAYYGGCVTIKAYAPVFSLNLSHIDAPYADFGGWCDRYPSFPQHVYNVPPTNPNNGSPSVPCVPYPECAGV